MTLRQALRDLRFWLDESADWYTDGERTVALNRATLEWVKERYEAGAESRERLRSDLSPLTIRKEGEGNRIVLPKADRLWLILSLQVYRWTQEKGFHDAVPARPVTEDQVGNVRRSVFWKPTNRFPVYTSYAFRDSRVIDIEASSPVDRWTLAYIAEPIPLDITKADTEWGSVPEPDQVHVIQRAARMLMAQKNGDYGAQAQLEAVST